MSESEHKDYRSLGEILRDAREAQGRSVEDIAEETKISPRMIEALEADDLDKIATPLYARSFVKDLGVTLGLDVDWLFVKLEGAGSEPGRSSPAVELPQPVAESPSADLPRYPPKKPAPKEPETTTWHIETVQDTRVRRIETPGGSTLRWVVGAIVVLAIAAAAFWMFRSGDGGGEAGRGEASPQPVVTASGTNGEPAGPPEFLDARPQAEEQRPSAPVPEPLDLSTAVLAGGSDVRAANAESIVAGAEQRDSGATEAASESEAESKAESEAGPSAGESTVAVARRADEPRDKNEGGLPSATPASGDPSPAAPVESSPVGRGTEQLVADTGDRQGLASIVRPGVEPATGQMVLEIRALAKVEVWAAADGGTRQRRSLVADEVWRLNGSDHFSVRLGDPAVVEVALDGEPRRPPAGSTGEWLIYP